MEFRILGPMEVWHRGQQVRLGGARPQRVLAALLLADGQVVPVGRLVDAVWDDDPPETATKQVRNAVSDLRRLLGDTGCAIDSSAAGYRLDISSGTLDAAVFARKTAQAHSHLTERSPSDAAVEFRAALALWSGPPLAGIDSPALQPQIARLTEQRLTALEECFEVELGLGRHHELTGELAGLVAEYPLRERLVGQLMLALYRSGSQARALDVYEQTRRTLAGELGIDPGPALRELRQRIVRDDPALLPSAPRSPQVPRCDLPRDVSHFTGRVDELVQLLDPVQHEQGARFPTAVLISAMDGMAGIGKTTLAVHAAHRLAERYPDGQLFIDLHAHTPGQSPLTPAAALARLLRAVDVPSEKVPQDLEERAALWRARLADRRALIVLDNAADTAQIRPLLPGTSRCLTLVTSRSRLTDLDGALLLSLDVLPPDDARKLLTRVIGDDRPAAGPDAVGDVLEQCGYLPLALRIAGARLRHRPTWTIAHFAARLRDHQRRLTELHTEDSSVAAAFGLSYHQLPPGPQRLFRLLGLIPGPDVDAHAAAALADLPAYRAEDLLESLVDAHLLQQSTPGRYHFHDLLRTYAHALTAETDSAEEREQALTRLFDHYLFTASQAMDVVTPTEKPHRPEIAAPATEPQLLPTYEIALAWLEAERPNLLAVAHHAADHGWPDHTCRLSTTLWRYFHICGNHDDALALHTEALEAARRAGNPAFESDTLASLSYIEWWLGNYSEALEQGLKALVLARETASWAVEARTLHGLGLVYCRFGQYEEALANHQEALEVSRANNDQACEGYALRGLGLVHSRLGNHEEALSRHRQALQLAQEIRNVNIQGWAMRGLGGVYCDLGRHEEALVHGQKALDLAREARNRNIECRALHGLGVIHGRIGDHEHALLNCRQALEIGEDLGDRYEQARAHDGMAHAYHHLGRPELARRHWTRALALYTRLGVPDAEDARANLDTPGGHVRHVVD